jgi:hypothetical protein
VEKFVMPYYFSRRADKPIKSILKNQISYFDEIRRREAKVCDVGGKKTSTFAI